MQLTVDRIVGFEQGRVAVEHELNRGLNDRLAARQADGARGIPMLLVCECGRSECAETMEVSPAEYEAVRSCCRLYLVAPDHESPGVTEVIVEVLPRFLMVELLPSAAAAAARQEAGDGARPVTTERRINARDRLTPQNHSPLSFEGTHMTHGAHDAEENRNARNADHGVPPKSGFVSSSEYTEEGVIHMATLEAGRRRSMASPKDAVRLTTETKHSFKTTEFFAMLALIAGILIASWLVGDDGSGGADGGDAFPAVRAWLYVAIVGSAYMVSRGLAKAGSRDPYWADRGDIPGGGNRD